MASLAPGKADAGEVAYVTLGPSPSEQDEKDDESCLVQGQCGTKLAGVAAVGDSETELRGQVSST